MSKKKIAFIAKTNLNTDGRILNELQIIKNKFHDQIIIDFILLPDKPLTIDLNCVDNLHVIKTGIRNNSFLRFFTVIEFTFLALFKLAKIKPNILHVQDTAVALPAYLYRLFAGSKLKIIYDDHELPNENESFYIKLMQYFENKLIKKSDFVLFANKERQLYLHQQLEFDLARSGYLLNLPYFEKSDKVISVNKVREVQKEKEQKKMKFIIHQGTISKERGREELAEFSRILPANNKILIVGVSYEYFVDFVNEYNLNIDSFYFIGLVSYHTLNEYWQLADASIVMYLPNFLNNRLCAPNRLYLSFKNGLPIVVNKTNPVLSSFVLENECGIFIEDIHKANYTSIFDIKYSMNKIDYLINSEVSKLENVYKLLLSL